MTALERRVRRARDANKKRVLNVVLDVVKTLEDPMPFELHVLMFQNGFEESESRDAMQQLINDGKLELTYKRRLMLSCR